jgi:hypothetical protein
MLKINSAFYGTKDVTDILTSLINDNKLSIEVNNSIFNDDEQSDNFKKLSVNYNYNDDDDKNIIVYEGSIFNLPDTTNITNKIINKIEEIFNAWKISFNPDLNQSKLAAKRIEICNSCEFKAVTELFNQELYVRCSVCGCALKGKIFTLNTFKDGGSCPKNKWQIVEEKFLNGNLD